MEAASCRREKSRSSMAEVWPFPRRMPGVQSSSACGTEGNGFTLFVPHMRFNY